MKKENWSKGKIGGTVITDTTDGLTDNSGHTGADADKYYGGALICESVWRKKDVALISAAPDMLEALIEIMKWNAHFPNAMNDIIVKANEAIKKATDI